MSVARENFLEKLKREREEAAQIKSATKNAATAETTSHPPASLPTLKSTKIESSSSSSGDSSSDEEPASQKTVATTPKAVNGVRKGRKASTSSSTSSSSESDDEDNLIMRKKSKAFVENGRVSRSFRLLAYSNVESFGKYICR